MTKIEWVKGSDGAQGKTWNPLAGCSIITLGCRNCYAMKMAARLEAMGQPLYAGLTEKVNGNIVWTGVMRQASDAVLFAPTQRSKPTTYFVNSMSDLFHEDVPDEWIDRIIGVMARTPWHTYQVLTKRSDRMKEYMLGVDAEKFVRFWSERMPYSEGILGFPARAPQWPLPNLWLGVSTERQKEANERIPDLLATPAAIRFISAEPLLGPIRLHQLEREGINSVFIDNALDGFISNGCGGSFGNKLDLVIVGCESGTGARPMDEAWPRALRDQCAATGTAFFMKQLSGPKGKAIKDIALFPTDLQIREMPHVASI